MVSRVVSFLTSLKLTVICLACSMVLVFIGTLAQVDEGLYAAQERYFKSFLIYLTSDDGGSRIPIFPGGYLVGTVLLINLLAAHAKRFSFTKKKAGIFLIHVGLILLLLGQLFTDVLSRESALRFEEGESKNFSEAFRKYELALVDNSDSETETIVSIPESRLRPGATIEDPSLPVTIKIHEFWRNSDIVAQKRDGTLETKANQGPAKDFQVLPLDPVTEMDAYDIPSAVVEILNNGTTLGTWLLSAALKPQTLEVDGKNFSMTLRFKRYYEDFSLSLLDARHDNYKGTDLPKNFSSRVRIQNENTKEDREVLIYMNHPLRYGGLTFYQFQMVADEARLKPGMIPSSTLQVVRNPTWLAPYLACALVGIGMLVQFLMHLSGFLSKQRKRMATAS